MSQTSFIGAEMAVFDVLIFVFGDDFVPKTGFNIMHVVQIP